MLVVGASPFQVPLIQTLQAHGDTTYAISNRPHDPGLQIADCGASISILDFERIESFIESEHIDYAITCGSDIATLTVARLNQKLGLPGCTEDQVLSVTHKGRFNTLLKQLNLNHVPFQNVAEESDINQIADRIPRYPVILKPVFSSGSRGIATAHSKEEILTTHEHTLNASFLFKGTVIQEMIEGVEIGGECLVEDSKVAFLEFTVKTNNQYRVPIGHFVPNLISDSVRSRIKEQIEAIAGHLGIKNTPVNIDTIITPDQTPYIIDMSFRLGGNLLPDLMRLKYGFDPYGRIIDYTATEMIAPVAWSPNPKAYGCLIFYSDVDGTLTRQKMEDITGLLKPHAPIEMQFDIPESGRYQPFVEGSRRFGHALCAFESLHAYQELLNNYSALIHRGPQG